MQFIHAVVWLDHQEAHVIHFNAQASESAVIKTKSKHAHLHHHKGAVGSGKSAEDTQYLHEVARGVADAQEVLIVGPGSAKMSLIKHIHEHDTPLEKKIVGVETVDHPSDPQLLAYAKKYFIKVDQMRGDTF